nr:cellulose biosynthesis cyclic di-GMP-binding regulatory protein BcsB [Chromobacterium sp. ASV5]
MKMTIKKQCLALALAMGAALPPSWGAPAPDASAPRAEQAAVSPLLASRTLSFKQMGASYPLKMRGDNSMAGVSFGSRRDEVITSLTLQLRYSFSPAMLADLSHIQVLLNDEVVTVLALPKEQGGKPQQATLTLDPRLLANFNQLKFRLVGHYTDRCENEAHSSIWAEISNGSELKMTVQALPIVNDLSYFPEPFFDRRDFSMLKLPMVFAAQPSPGALRAAGELASWFGAQAGWRGARFEALLDVLPPPRHAVAFATNAQRPAFLAKLPPVKGPTISIIPHPQRAERKLLLIQGRDDKDLQLAAHALVLGQAGMTGGAVAVRQVKLDAPRKPYDAPSWVRSDRPTRVGELVSRPEELQVSGQQLAPIRVSFRVPADLFTWGSRGIPLDLKFRYTGTQQASGSRLNIGINELFVQSLNLNPSGVGSAQTDLRLPVLENGLLSNVDRVLLPPFRVGSRNELQFQYSFAHEKQGECNSGLADNYRAEIDPDSTIDFSQYPHYAAMPNLALFASSGFPFTRMADLSETAVVLPVRPQAQDIAAFLTVMGRMGESTGYPALRYRLVDESQLAGVKDADLLVIGNSRQLKLLQTWQQYLPTRLSGDARQVADGINRPPLAWLSRRPVGREGNPVGGQADFVAQGRVAALLGLESPLNAGRSAVIVTANEADGMSLAANALTDDAKLDQISGSAALLRGDNIDSQQLGPVYHVGSLPLWTWVWLYLSAHPLLLACLSALAVLIGAFAILRLFKALAARRLKDS